MKVGKLKVVQMRKELEARGLDSSGNRPVLMKRLREALEREGSTSGNAHAAGRVASDHPERSTSFAEERRERPDEHPQPREQKQGGAAEPPSEQPGQKEGGSHAAGGEGANGKRGSYRDGESEPQEQVGELRQASQVETRKEAKQVEGQPDNRDGNVAAVSAEDPSVEKGVDGRRENAASGNLALASKTAEEERLRNRRQRFGTVKPVLTPSQAKKEEMKRFEELKRRRAAKFGPIAPAENDASAPEISSEERERRLKRQRRFQTVGSTAV